MFGDNNPQGKLRWRSITLCILALVALFSAAVSAATRGGATTGNFLWFTDIHFDPLYSPDPAHAKTFCRVPANDTESGHQVVEGFYINKVDESFNKIKYPPAQQQKRQRLPALNINSRKKSKKPVAQRRQQQPNGAIFGRYGCDAPITLVTAALEEMQQQIPNPDFIIMTGDFPAHFMPNSNWTLEVTGQLVPLIKKYYPTQQIFPVIGNNDLYPDYYLQWGEEGEPWLQSIFNLWEPLLASCENIDDIRSTFLKGGYYQTRVMPGLRVIALNSLYWSADHTPTYAPSPPSPPDTLPTDPSGQFAWFAEALANATKNQEKVYVLTHIPASNNNYDNMILWYEQYLDTFYSIISQYPDTIVTTFYGHLHNDEIRLAFNNETNKAYGFGMIAPAISPVFHTNPGFREFSYDKNSFELLNYIQHYMDLWESNNHGVPVWKQEYDFKRQYNENGVNTKAIFDLYQQMEDSALVFSQYVAFMNSLYTQNRYSYYCAISALTNDEYQACLSEGSDSGMAWTGGDRGLYQR